MKLTQELNGAELLVHVEGSIDTTTATQFDDTLVKMLSGVTSLILDFGGVDYVSSAGLRSVLKANKAMLAVKGKMLLKNVKPEVMKLFVITGFRKFLNIQEG